MGNAHAHDVEGETTPRAEDVEGETSQGAEEFYDDEETTYEVPRAPEVQRGGHEVQRRASGALKVQTKELAADTQLLLHDGKSSQLEHVSIRDSKVRFIVIPDMLKNAPMFKRLDARIKGKGASLGVGRGRAVAIRAKVLTQFSFFQT
ncbi:hypothetical protein LR48_Vigan08g134700 [Vigna angularis]|uniref:LSM domain-containing protein n=1 Tax=Phaseolus angularis TaxID=3914 RepID=A0A0L9V644_PHAAN|nr:hypothetical protein LR48_Vigan08g134700 [Vigna angularis]